MLAGTTKWAQSLQREGWPVAEFDEGFIKSGPDSGREGLGALAMGEEGVAWVIHGRLGGLISRKARQVGWDEVRLVSITDEAISIGLGPERGVVSFRSVLWSSRESEGWLHTSRYQFWKFARERLAPEGQELIEDLDPGTHAEWSYYTAERRKKEWGSGA